MPHIIHSWKQYKMSWTFTPSGILPLSLWPRAQMCLQGLFFPIGIKFPWVYSSLTGTTEVLNAPLEEGRILRLAGEGCRWKPDIRKGNQTSWSDLYDDGAGGGYYWARTAELDFQSGLNRASCQSTTSPTAKYVKRDLQILSIHPTETQLYISAVL